MISPPVSIEVGWKCQKTDKKHEKQHDGTKGFGGMNWHYWDWKISGIRDIKMVSWRPRGSSTQLILLCLLQKVQAMRQTILGAWLPGTYYCSHCGWLWHSQAATQSDSWCAKQFPLGQQVFVHSWTPFSPRPVFSNPPHGWMNGWMDGWTDGWMDGCCVNIGGRGCGGRRSAPLQCNPSINSIWGKHIQWLMGHGQGWLVGLLDIAWDSAWFCAGSRDYLPGEEERWGIKKTGWKW